MDPFSVVAVALAKVGAECFSASFAAGIAGNLIASAGYDHLVKNPVDSALRSLRDLVKSGVTSENHDLLRALWIAQNEALVLCCEEILRCEKRLRPGGFAIPENLADFDAWASGFAQNDAEVKALLLLRSMALKQARRYASIPMDQLQRETALALPDTPALFSSGSEFSPRPALDMQQKAAEQFLASLQASLSGSQLFPVSLQDKLRQNWFGYLRSAFREVLKRYPHAKTAFEFSIWEKIETLPEALRGQSLKLDDALLRLERLDAASERIYQQLRWLVEAVSEIAEGVNAQHVQTNDRVQALEANLASALEQWANELKRFQTQFVIQPVKPVREIKGEGRESYLLHPEAGAIPLVGREKEFNDLWNWAHQEAEVGVLMIGAGPGAGKTRLGFELLQALQQAKGCSSDKAHPLDPWRIGRVKTASLQKFDAKNDWADWDWDRPTVLLVDYALEARQPLKNLMQRARDIVDREPRPPLRLLLIEREGSAKSLLEELAQSIPAQGRFHLAPTPFLLPILDSAAIRRELLQGALRRMAKERPAPELPPESQSDFQAQLMHPDRAQPLYLLMTAWEIVSSGKMMDSMRLSRSTLVQRAAQRELDRASRLPRANEGASKLFRHLAAYATLCRGLSHEETLAAVKTEMAALQRNGALEVAGVADHLHDVLGAASVYVGPILPDIVGERVLYDTLAAMPSDKARMEFFTRAARQKPTHVFQTLIRTAGDLPLSEALQFEKWLLALARDWDTNAPDLLDSFAIALPRYSVALLRVNAEVSERLIPRARIKAEASQAESDLAELANLLNTQGVRFSECGHALKAFPITQEAVEIYRGLAGKNREAYAPVLAGSLNNLGNRFRELGRRSKALPVAKEAVQIRRSLARKNWEAYAPVLAMSLNNLGVHFSELRRHSEALPVTKEAMQIYRDLAGKNWEAYAPVLAMSLNNLGNLFSELGRHSEALPVGEEAMQIYRDLAGKNWEAYAPDLAMSLNNLGNRLSELGRPSEALPVTEEAVQIRRDLAGKNWEAYAPKLAQSLWALSLVLEADQPESAMASIVESVLIYIPFLQKLPAAFASPMRETVQVYLRLSKTLQQSPDPALLGPVEEILQEKFLP